jgi:probable F420-dependent oxidoreductase
MRITYGPWGESLDELVDAARRAERAGAQVLWVPELHRSATVPIAAMAHATESARLGTGIALAFTRSPMLQALEALDLDELSCGRFVLGLGTGVRRLNEDWHNARFGKPVAHMRETVRNVRAFWAAAGSGTAIDLPGDHEPMRVRGYRRPFHQPRVRIPIYLAAMGPAMTRLAGEIADGWISHELFSARYLERVTLPELAKGLARGGRARGDIDVVASVLCAIDDDPRSAKRWAAGTVGFYASVRTYADFWAFHGLAEQQRAVVENFRAGATADDLANAAGDAMVDAVTAAGTADQVREKILAFEGLADSVKLSPSTHGVDASITRRCQDRIIELIATL